MVHTENYFCWSDNWWIEGNNAWFVDGEHGILFQMDFLTNKGEFIQKLPNCEEEKFRLNPRCIKYNDSIICMPDLGQYIWIYNHNQFKKIEIKNPNRDRILINNFWKFDEKLFAISVGLKQIIEINVEKQVIDNYYSLNIPNVEIDGNVRVGEKIFIVSAVSNEIYEFDLITKKTVTYILDAIKDKLNTICFDGDKFWLSGYAKAVYIWNKTNNLIEVIKDFPDGFGIYDYAGECENILNCEKDIYETPIFKEIKYIGKNIWFIPFKTNKILYTNKNIPEFFSLNIEEENETRDSLKKNYMAHKYLVLYIKEDRYIGLFSFKNGCILEIDTLNFCIKNRKFFLSIQSLYEILYDRIFGEYQYLDRMLYQNTLLRDSSNLIDSQFRNIGKRIYESFK